MPILSCEHCHRFGDRNTLIISFALRPHVDLFGFLIPVLLALVAANVEGTNKPLMEKHGINIWAFLVGLGVYCFAFVADINSRIQDDHQTNYSVIAVVSGSVSAVSLVSTLVPQVIGYIILCISWIFAAIFIVVVYEDGKLYKGACSCTWKYIMEPVLTHIRNKWFHEASINNIVSSSSRQKPLAAISDII